MTTNEDESINIEYLDRLEGDPNFTFFKVLFEVISAYGTVGLSLGYSPPLFLFFCFSFLFVWLFIHLLISRI